MSDFIASLLMILVFAGTWFVLFYVGGSSWLADASVLRAKYQHSGEVPGVDAMPRTGSKANASPAARAAARSRLVPA